MFCCVSMPVSARLCVPAQFASLGAHVRVSVHASCSCLTLLIVRMRFVRPVPESFVLSPPLCASVFISLRARMCASLCPSGSYHAAAIVSRRTRTCVTSVFLCIGQGPVRVRTGSSLSRDQATDLSTVRVIGTFKFLGANVMRSASVCMCMRKRTCCTRYRDCVWLV